MKCREQIPNLSPNDERDSVGVFTIDRKSERIYTNHYYEGNSLSYIHTVVPHSFKFDEYSISDIYKTFKPIDLLLNI